MDLDLFYEQLFKEGIQTLKADEYTTDPYLLAGKDHRFGITLLLRPDRAIRQEIQSFFHPFIQTDPNQYYYPHTDIHVTILSIISCYEGFRLSQIDPRKYIRAIQQCVDQTQPFDIIYRGITLSADAVMVRGHLADDSLNQFRNCLRAQIKNSELADSIDKRYAIFTAHSTVIRYQYPLHNKDRWIELLEEHENHDFGRQTVREVELVYNDWYQRASKVQVLHTFELPD
ncbi:MAG TPA: hypothetical protein VIK80_14535 [Flavihumibacter sp.]|jgi:2'-5' RNA ligase